MYCTKSGPHIQLSISQLQSWGERSPGLHLIQSNSKPKECISEGGEGRGGRGNRSVFRKSKNLKIPIFNAVCISDVLLENLLMCTQHLISPPSLQSFSIAQRGINLNLIDPLPSSFSQGNFSFLLPFQENPLSPSLFAWQTCPRKFCGKQGVPKSLFFPNVGESPERVCVLCCVWYSSFFHQAEVL